jgi:PTH1 family peptidyl-tRNA hydrolase
MDHPISLIAGLGNPGRQYQHTRHNAGALFLDLICSGARIELKPERKFQGLVGVATIDGRDIRLIFPTTYMNNSGRAISALGSYYKIPSQEVLIAYDELDLPLGTTRLKYGGGAAGHNGVKDVISALGTNDFYRLRFGIANPQASKRGMDYVLDDFSRSDMDLMNREFDKALAILPLLVQGKPEFAMQALHTKE